MRVETVKGYVEKLDAAGVGITEKRKFIELILEALDSSTVRQQLSEATTKNEDFTWNSIFDLAKRLADEEYIASKRAFSKPKETGQKAASKRSTSGKPPSTECFNFLKLILQRFSEAGVDGLPADELSNFCFRVLEDELDAIRSAYSKDACQIIAKHILCDPVRCSTVSSTRFQNLISSVAELLLHCGEPVQYSDTLRVAVAAAVAKGEKCSYIFDKLETLFEMYTNKSFKKCWENMVACANHLCESCGIDQRLRLCKFGDNVGGKIIDFFDAFADQNLQKEVTKFFCFQFVLHYPNNVKGSERGAISSESWEVIVKELYKKLCNDLTKVALKYSDRRSIPCLLSVDTLELASRIFIQTFSENDAAVAIAADINEVASDSGTMCFDTPVQQPPRKRQRVEVGWQSLLNSISSLLNGKDATRVTPWFEIMEYLLSNYAESISDDDAVSIMKELISMAETIKRPEILCRLLNVLRAAIFKFAPHRQSKRVEFSNLSAAFRPVLQRMISSQSVQCHGASVISALIQSGLYSSDGADSELIRLLGIVLTEVHPEVLTWIFSVVTKCDFDEKLSLNGADSAKEEQQYAFRSAVMNWLLAAPALFVDEYAGDGETGENSMGIRALKLCSPAQVAEILILLICDKPGQASLCASIANVEKNPIRYRILEEFLVQALCLGNVDVKSGTASTSGTETGVVQCVYPVAERFIDKLVSLSTALLNLLMAKKDISVNEFKNLVDHWCLLWCFSTLFASFFTSDLAAFQRLLPLSSEFWHAIEKLTDIPNNEFKKIFLQRATETVDALVERGINLPASLAPARLLDRIAFIAEKEFSAYGSGKKQRQNISDGAQNSVSAFGAALQFSCLAKDLVSTEVPDICRDFLVTVRDSPMEYPLIVSTLRQVSRFFDSDPSNDKNISPLFLGMIKVLLKENRPDSGRMCQLLSLLESLASWAAAQKNIGGEYLELLSSLLSFNQEELQELLPSEVIASLLNCYARFLKAGGCPENDVLTLDCLLKLERPSFRFCYTLGQITLHMVKAVGSVEQVAKWFLSQLRKAEDEDDKNSLISCFAVTICNLMQLGPLYHAPCLLRLLDAAKKDWLDQKLCKVILQRIVGSGNVKTVLEGNLDVAVSYWIRRCGTNFGNFPYELWGASNLDEFLQTQWKRLIALASMAVGPEDHASFLRNFNDYNTNDEEFIAYLLAAAACTTAPKDSTAYKFLKILKVGEDMRTVALENLVGTIALLCQWMVFGRDAIPNTIELTESSWNRSMEWLLKTTKYSNFTAALSSLPERSIPRFMFVLRNLAFRSFSKSRWIDILALVASRIDYRKLDGSMKAFMVREILSIVCTLHRDISDGTEVSASLSKLKDLCTLLRDQAGEGIICEFDCVLSAAIQASKKCNSSEKQAMETAQSIVQLMRKSKSVLASSPLLPTRWKALRAEQLEARKLWDLAKVCQVLNQRPLWMITVEELEFFSTFVSGLGQRSAAAEDCQSCTSVARKLLLLVESATEHDLRNGALRSLAKLCMYRQQCVLDALLYPWNYNELFEESFLVTLDECICSERPHVAYLAAECLIKAVDSIPSIASALKETKDRFQALQAFLVSDEASPHLTSLNVSGWLQENPSSSAFSEFISQLRRYDDGNAVLIATMGRLFIEEPSIGERLLPYVIEHLIRQSQSFSRFAAEQMNQALRHIVDEAQVCCHRQDFHGLVRCILGCVKRLQHTDMKEPGWRNYCILPLDYLLLAQATSLSGLPSMTPLFMELGTESIRTREMELRFDVLGESESLFSDMPAKRAIGSTLLECFLALKDAEALESLGEFAALDSRSRTLASEMDGDISKLITLYSTISDASELMPWYFLSAVSSHNASKCGKASVKVQENGYSCAWKLCQWDAFEQPKMNMASCTFDQLLYENLRSLGVDGVKEPSHIWNHLARSLTEHTVIPQLLLRRLCLAEELEEAVSAVKDGKPEDNFLRLDHGKPNNFGDRLWCYHAMLDRVLTSKDLVQKLQSSWIAKQFTPVCCDLLELCRRKNLHHIGLQVLEKSKKALVSLFGKQSNMADVFMVKLELEETELLWASGEDLRASSLLKALATRLEKRRNEPELLCALTRCLVLLRDFKLQWRTVANSAMTSDEKFMEITRLMESAARNKPSSEVSAALGDAHLAMAQFANRQYQETTEYMKSPVFVARKANIERLRQEAQTVGTTLKCKSPLVGPSAEEKTYMFASQRKGDIDHDEVMEMLNRQHMQLVTALQCYMSVLALCSDHDVVIFRVVSLWFDNFSVTEATKTVETQLKSIKSYKWLAAFPQVAAHLTTKPGSGYAKVIRELVLNIVSDHPFHAFYTLNALTIAEPRDDADKKRKAAAGEVLERAMKGPRGTIFKDLKKLTESLMSLHTGNLKLTAKQAEIPANHPILLGIGDLPLPTVTIEPSPTGDYKAVPKIVSFERNVSVMSGVSLPKRITCVCSDGVRRRFLLKGGQDDPRQDALMEQVFRVVNVRLKRKEREVGAYDGQYGSMRTYNVVPLAPTIGLIEFCDECVALGEYIDGARKMYYPDSPSVTYCRQQINEAAKASSDTRLRVFQDICKQMRPVFRHFFYERFPDANEWLERRQVYTISVAVSSMVGHIIGLSDRHVNNIMIDKITGEIVQIDHGMAFEQGRLLPTPETVPFRLTRDMTNPMGICGLNGVFRRSCVRTLTVLKESKDILMPILSVLLHDPVSQWTLTPSKARQKQPEKSNAVNPTCAENKNVHAERAIIRVSDKLNGREKTELLSVDGQVSHLIDQARDPKNLCMMYNGWQAFL